MNKVASQGLALVLVFVLMLFASNQVDWMGLFRVEKATEKTEEKIGELIWENIQMGEVEITLDSITNAIDSIVTRICTGNDIDRDKLKLHVLYSSEINAFALPDGHIIVYSGLIEASENQEQLAGVIGHEIAHIELNHIMKKLVKEVGLSVLVSMAAGSGGGEIITQSVQVLSSSAFDRNLEEEADLKAVDYLSNADIDPEPFANFLYNLSLEEPEMMKYFSWISTHPDSQERAETIVTYSQDLEVKNKPVLSDGEWEQLQDLVQNYYY